jgi:membrane protein YdbS with pleckstrin-like domain
MLPPQKRRALWALAILIVAQGLVHFLWPRPNKPQSAFIAVTTVAMLVTLICTPKLATLIARQKIRAKKLSSSLERS